MAEIIDAWRACLVGFNQQCCIYVFPDFSSQCQFPQVEINSLTLKKFLFTVIISRPAATLFGIYLSRYGMYVKESNNEVYL